MWKFKAYNNKHVYTLSKENLRPSNLLPFFLVNSRGYILVTVISVLIGRTEKHREWACVLVKHFLRSLLCHPPL